jgi:hypothetical protein
MLLAFFSPSPTARTPDNACQSIRQDAAQEPASPYIHALAGIHLLQSRMTDTTIHLVIASRAVCGACPGDLAGEAIPSYAA